MNLAWKDWCKQVSSKTLAYRHVTVDVDQKSERDHGVLQRFDQIVDGTSVSDPTSNTKHALT
jgi:hypothetical protein